MQELTTYPVRVSAAAGQLTLTLAAAVPVDLFGQPSAVMLPLTADEQRQLARDIGALLHTRDPQQTSEQLLACGQRVWATLDEHDNVWLLVCADGATEDELHACPVDEHEAGVLSLTLAHGDAGASAN